MNVQSLKLLVKIVGPGIKRRYKLSETVSAEEGLLITLRFGILDFYH
jgi:hypothetical protein